MSDAGGYLAGLEDAVRAIEIRSATTFRWFGKSSTRLPDRIRRALPAETARSYLLYNLQARLYTSFYCQSVATRWVADVGSQPITGMTPFVEQLTAANCGTGHWVGGWQVLALDGDRLAVDKLGITVRARPEDCRSADGLEGDGQDGLAPGTQVLMHFPGQAIALSPGYYMALGDNRLRGEGGEPLVRFYWHVEPAGAAPLTRAITTSMNEANLQFRFKVLNDPTRFTRCDSAVLYVRKADYPAVATILERAYSEMAGNMLPLTPAFTKQLAPGLGFAEDPGGAQSFGHHRCHILAEGLLRAHELRRRDLQARLRTVMEGFEAEGIDLERPYLNPGSSDNYSFQVTPRRPWQSMPAEKLVGSATSAPHTVEEYLDTAVTIGRGIVRDAIWHGELCNWMGARIEPNRGAGQYEMTYTALGPSIWEGTAGMALFLGELWSVAPDEAFRRTAIGAMRHALSRVDDVSPALQPGLYSGWAGLALVSARLGRLLNEEELLLRAGELVDRLLREPGESWEQDLLMGRAGAVAALAVLSYYLPDDAPLRCASRMADDLLVAADTNGPGSSWRSGITRSAHNLTGLSHGAAGIGYALLELWAITGETSYRQAAEVAFAYERHWFNREEGNWPDFRLEPGETHGAGMRNAEFGMRNNARQHTSHSTSRIQHSAFSRRRWPSATYWCNGAPGIALTRLRAYDLLKDEGYRAEAEAGLLATRQAEEAWLHSGSANYSLCHGLAGNAEILLEGARGLGPVWKDVQIARATAWEVANRGIENYGNGKRPWPCGLLRGQTPSLMLGLAGIGYFYLRLHSPSVPSILLVRPEEWRLNA